MYFPIHEVKYKNQLTEKERLFLSWKLSYYQKKLIKAELKFWGKKDRAILSAVKLNTNFKRDAGIQNFS